MYHLINNNVLALVRLLECRGDIDAYVGLCSGLASGHSAALLPEFQRSYRSYWSMNAARLPPSFYERYFGLLAECQGVEGANVEHVARVISGVGYANYGLQFSFATKLAHMVDARIPVYDGFIARFYFFSPPTSDRPFDERLGVYVKFHSFLVQEYSRILRLGLLERAIDQIRSYEKVTPAIPNERIVDWLIWAWVSLLRNGVQRNGEALYE